MSLHKAFVSAPAAALGLAIALSGCLIETDEEWHGVHECSVDARTSGAYDGRITAVEGCTIGATSITSADAAPELVREIGVVLRDARPFAQLELSLFEPLEDEGEGIAVTITATSREGVLWVTPDGACTANYVSKTCDDEGDEPGRQYTLRDVICSDPAIAEDEPDLVIEDFQITSTCEPESQWRLE